METTEEKINTLVRDLTKVGGIPKSEVKRRIKEIEQSAYNRGKQEFENKMGTSIKEFFGVISKDWWDNDIKPKIKNMIVDSLKK